ncbi:hypothetical protein [Tenacibaculum sp. UWU-22]|uniref:IS1096 element passenger TnpR family protein n=1 Tax=Tenacibaculum sp. UWU-22 TaxID=3234187 RepID=UPI0034DACAB4
MYKIRVILDTKEDVIRTLAIDEKATLETLHYTIAKSFGFNGLEMSSFYKSDDDWNQGEEIPLFNMSEDNDGVSMATEILKNTLPEKNGKLIYVYDFLLLWTFYVEVVDINSEQLAGSKILLSIGQIPNKAPEKEFKADDDWDNDSDLDEDFNDFDDFDDFDFYQN